MNYLTHLAIFIAIYSILGLSLNLVVGYTGLFSIAHAVFYGIGAYSTAILLSRHEVNFFLTVIVGIVITVIISFIFGIFLSRFNDDYYAIVSMGFGIIAYIIFQNWHSLTNGPHGFWGIQRPAMLGYTFSSNISFLILILAVLGIIYLICRLIVKSSFGRVLKSIREDEKAIEIFGYNTTYYKLTIFIISSSIASIAGSFFGSYMTYVGPEMFMLSESIFLVVIIILGGLGTLAGSILGAVFMILIPEALRFLGLPITVAGQLQQIIYGTVLILIIMLRPHGLIGEYRL